MIMSLAFHFDIFTVQPHLNTEKIKNENNY